MTKNYKINNNLELESLYNIFFIIFLTISSIIFIYLVALENYDFSNRIVKRYLLILFFITVILIYGFKVKSIASSFCFIYPSSIILRRSLIDFGKLFGIDHKYNFTFDTYEIFIYFTFMIILLIFLIRINLYRGKNEMIFTPMKYFLLFSAFGVLSLWWAKEPSAGISSIFALITFPISFIVFNELFIVNTNNITHFIRGVFLSALLSIIFVWPELFGFPWFAQYIGETSTVSQSEGLIRAGGLVSKSIFSVYTAMTIPFMFASFLLRTDINDVEKNILLVSMILFIATLAMTLYRMPFVATMFGMMLIYKKAWSLNRISGKYLKSILLLFILFTVLYLAIVYSRNFTEDVLFRKTWSGRLLANKAALLNFKNSKGLGVGLNNFLETKATVAFLGSDSWFIKYRKTVHNDYLKIMSELGLIGISLFLVFLYKFLTFQNPESEKSYAIVFGVKISLITLSIISLTDIPFHRPVVLIFLGAYGAILRNAHKLN